MGAIIGNKRIVQLIAYYPRDETVVFLFFSENLLQLLCYPLVWILNFCLLQIIYIVIVGVTYYFIAISCFAYIPGYYLGGIHR